MNKQKIKKNFPRRFVNTGIFVSRFLRSPKFLFTKTSFFKYNYYNFKEFILGKKDFILKYGNLKFYNFGREVLNEKNDKTYLRLNNCNCVLDLGGYNGDTALFLSEQKNERIFVFEPEKEKFEYIKKNITLNRKENRIFSYDFAVVVNNKKEMDLYKNSEYDIASSIYQEHSSGKNKETIKCMHIANALKLGNFDGMKCDIEGGEWDIINWLIKKNKLKEFKKIIFELHFSKKNPKWDKEFVKLIKYLKEKKIKHIFLYCDGGKEIKKVNKEIKKILNKKYAKNNHSLMLFIAN